MLATNHLTIDVGRKAVQPVLPASQGDEGYSVNVTILNNGIQAVDHTTDTAKVYVQKADGHGVESIATVNEDDTVSFTVTSQMLAVNGRARVQITVFDGNDVVKSTPVFYFDVERKPVADGVQSTSDYETLKALKQEVEALLQNFSLPVSAGTYRLKVTISNNQPTYAWISSS